MPERRALKIDDFNALRAEVAQLRGGYARAGQWSLAQVCYHVDRSMREAMNAPATPIPNTPEQDARAGLFAGVMRDARIPDGLSAPDHTAPPADVSDAAIDDLIATADRFERSSGPYSPHRLFGNLSPEVRRRHQLIHAAHHLSFLIPTAAMPARPTK